MLICASAACAKIEASYASVAGEKHGVWVGVAQLEIGVTLTDAENDGFCLFAIESGQDACASQVAVDIKTGGIVFAAGGVANRFDF